MPYVGNRSKLTKLNSREMAEFIADNSIRQVFDIPKSGEKEHYGFFSEDEGEVLFAHDIYAKLKGIYREDIPDENGNVRLTVYRVMYDFCRTTKLNLNESDKTRRRCYGQVIYVPSNDVKGWVWLEIQSVYKGEKYNNTPLAELDVKWGKNGWLFGTPAK